MSRHQYAFCILLTFLTCGLTRCAFMDSTPNLSSSISTVSHCAECCQYIPQGEKTTQCQVSKNGNCTLYRCYLDTDDKGQESCQCMEVKKTSLI